MSGDITSNICYLDRDERFETEKPFSWSTELAFIPGLPPSNHISTQHLAKIRDVRGCDSTNLDTQGFAFLRVPTCLKPEEVGDEALVESIYYAEIEEMLWSRFPDISRIAFLGHQVWYNACLKHGPPRTDRSPGPCSPESAAPCSRTKREPWSTPRSHRPWPTPT